MKKTVILGAGESGVGSAILAQKEGFQVFVSDKGKIQEKYKNVLNKYKIDWEELTHTFSKIEEAEEVIKSPGIPDNIELIQKLKEKNIPIISEIEFAGRYTTAKKICITGSNGKTTTTTMIYEMLKNAGVNVAVAGNIGESFARQVAEKDFDYFVIELSSFQLDGMYEFKADMAILMNITPDHLDRYEYNFQNYIDSKMRIVQNMDRNGIFIYWNEDEVINKEIEKRNLNGENSPKLFPFSDEKSFENGAFLQEENIVIKYINTEFSMLKKDLALKGKHNTYNSMAAAATGLSEGISKKIIRESMSRFLGVPHRLENVLKIRDVQYINDSKSTNVNSAWYALESIKTPIVWIAGGVDKGNDYNMLHDLVEEKVKLLICMGIDNKKLNAEFKDRTEIINVKSMQKALDAAYYYAEKGDTVLLSPACASFDLFKNYEDRGDKFKEGVRNL